MYKLVQGKILKEMSKGGVVCKILYYKVPAYTYKDEYDKPIDDLWAVDLSEDASQDKRLKKQIANITFGLMEKGENRKSQSRVYSNLNEALHQQRVNGGRLYVINELQMEEVDEGEVFHLKCWNFPQQTIKICALLAIGSTVFQLEIFSRDLQKISVNSHVFCFKQSLSGLFITFVGNP